jgi:hypothetical protein
MIIKDLIKALQAHPNQNARIKVISNASIGGEDEVMDIHLNNIEVWGEDDFNFEYVELFCYSEAINIEGDEL